jgi:hypothetical protein
MSLFTDGLFSKNAVARVINGALFLGGCFLAGSGWLLDRRLPSGRGAGGGRMALLGMSRHDWGAWHAWAGYGVAALVVAHLALHWRWLVMIAAARKPWRLALGLALGLAVAGFFVFAPVSGQGR